MATKYLVSGGNGNWLHSSNWSYTSGGTSGAPQPTATDDVIFDANSLNAPINVSSSSGCLTVFMSNYTGLITYSSTLNVGQSFEYSSGMTTAGSGSLSLGYNLSTPASVCAINFNGVTHNAGFSFNNNTGTLCTYTITGDMNIMSNVTFANSNLSGGAAVKITINGGDVLCNAGIAIFGNGNRWISGTSKIKLVGSGSGNYASGINSYLMNAGLVFQKTGGVINNTTGGVYLRNSQVTYISGTFTNFNLLQVAGVTTADTNNMVWANYSNAGGGLVLLSQLNVAGTFSNAVSLSIGGTGGINCNNLTTTKNILFPIGSTTRIANALTSIGTAAAPILIGSAVAGLKANMILSKSGSQDIAHTNGRDIDSNGGLTIYSYRPTSINNCDNWRNLPIITSVKTNTIIR